MNNQLLFRKGLPKKLNEEKVLEIFELARVTSVKEIAKTINISMTMVRNILRGACWRYVQNESISRYRGTGIKIRDEQTILFIRAFKSDKNRLVKDFAKKLGISSKHFSQIKNRRSRRGVKAASE